MSLEVAVARPSMTGPVARTLRCLAKQGVAGSRGSSLAGLLRLGQPRRPAPLGPRPTQAGAFSSGRTTAAAAAAAATDVEAQPAAPAAAAAAARGNGTFQSTAYPFTDIEAKWQAYWEEHKTFRTPEIHELDTSKPKFYALDMFPYPRWVLGWRPAAWLCRAVGGCLLMTSSSGSAAQLPLGLMRRCGGDRAACTAVWRCCCKQRVGPAGAAGAAARSLPGPRAHPAGPPHGACTRAAARACTWDTPRATQPLTLLLGTSACAASTCCTPWAGTRLACRRSSMRSRCECNESRQRSAPLLYLLLACRCRCCRCPTPLWPARCLPRPCCLPDTPTAPAPAPALPVPASRRARTRR